MRGGKGLSATAVTGLPGRGAGLSEETGSRVGVGAEAGQDGLKGDCLGIDFES